MAFTTVEGTVSRLNSRGTGFGVKETYTSKNGEKTTYWSVFLPDGVDRTVAEGQSVKVSGRLGTRVSERDARFVDHTLNNAKVLEESPGIPWASTQPAGAGPVVVAAQSWNTADETPF